MVTQLGTDPDPNARIRARQGKTIREVRELRGMSMEQLADEIGVTFGAISHWETGRFSPRREHQIGLARALNVPWSTIFGLDAEASA